MVSNKENFEKPSKHKAYRGIKVINIDNNYYQY